MSRLRWQRPSIGLTIVVALMTVGCTGSAVTFLAQDHMFDAMSVIVAAIGWSLLLWMWLPRSVRDVNPALDTVVARMSYGMRIAGVVAGVFGVGLLIGVHGGFASGADLLIAVPLALLGYFCVLAMVITWWYRASIGPDAVTVRVIWPHRVEFSAVESITVTDVTLHAGRMGGQSAIPRVVVSGPTAGGAPVRAGFDVTMSRFDEALVIIRDWARRRPELVEEADRAWLDASAPIEDAS